MNSSVTGKYNVICVDDESIILKGIMSIVKQCPLAGDIKGFTLVNGVLDYVKQNNVDIAFLDIEMYQVNGIELAKRLRAINPKIYVVFLTGYTEYAVEAFGIHANGFLKKPVCYEDIEKEFFHLDNVMKSVSHKKRIRVQTFGNFQVFIDDKDVRYSYHLSKEIIAYLIDRKGATVTISELVTLCDEYTKNEASAKSMIRTAVAEIRKIAAENNIDGFIEKARNTIKINPDLIDCDYYNYLAGDINAINSYTGEYMANYSWAELTNAWLMNNKK